MDKEIFTIGTNFIGNLEQYIDSCVEKDLLDSDTAMEHIEIINAISDYLERLKKDTTPF